MSDSVTCVFVHGWAMNSAVWDECVSQLPDWINVVLVDLPGHGSMADVNVSTLDDFVQALSPLVQRPVLWVGWSLGGLAVLRLAQLYPQRVAAALLVATSPCFVSRKNWPCAVEAAVFKQFAADLNRQQEKTIRRFLALQVKGLPDAMKVVRQLQQSIQQRGSASLPAMNSGLEMLLDTDLRDILNTVECPLHWALGGRDALLPAGLAQVLRDDYAQADVVFYPQAGHAPFLSHGDDFIHQLLAVAALLRNSQQA